MMRTRQGLEGVAVHDEERLSFSIRRKVERRGLYRGWGFRTLPEANAQSFTAQFGALYNNRDILQSSDCQAACICEVCGIDN
jgi:hypothetical protein